VIDEMDNAIGRGDVSLGHVSVLVDANSIAVHVQSDSIVVAVQCLKSLTVVETDGEFGVWDDVVLENLCQKRMVGRKRIDERMWQLSESVVGRRENGDAVCF